jgi:hypothetical protein
VSRWKVAELGVNGTLQQSPFGQHSSPPNGLWKTALAGVNELHFLRIPCFTKGSQLVSESWFVISKQAHSSR